MTEELPATEAVAEHTAELDGLPTPRLVETLLEEQRGAFDVATSQAAQIAHVVDEIAARLERGGCLHYVGAGTSGRLAALDAAEMPPTFGTPPGLVCAHVAGGPDALVRAVEGAEDDRHAGAGAMNDHVHVGDVVLGISASGSAPYVVAALERARDRGAYTVALVNAQPSALERAAGAVIALSTGAEAVAGSTRLKAGTAQKIVLNAISTAVMVRLGKVHGNLMVDVIATNRKLERRAELLVCRVAGVGTQRARELLALAGGRVKVAVVMQRHGLDAGAAAALLARHGGRLRPLV